jgi:DNA-binding transcriptional LysR family regulator
MELRYLRYFATVAELKNFSRAADKLHVAQSAISQQIKTLEDELGVKLLIRTKRSVTLAAAGEAFLTEAMGILDSVERSKLTARRAAKGEIGTISIGAFVAAASHFLPELIRDYRIRFPGVRVQLHELTPRQQLTAFAEGAIDLGFTRPLPANQAGRFVEERIYRDYPVAVLPENHPMAGISKIHLGSLARDEWVLFRRSEAPELMDGIVQLCVRAGFSPRPVMEPATMQIVLMMVAAGVGVSIVPRCVRCFGQPGVRFIPIRPSPPIDLVVARPKGETPPAVAAFLERVRSHLPAIRKVYESPQK